MRCSFVKLDYTECGEPATERLTYTANDPTVPERHEHVCTRHAAVNIRRRWNGTTTRTPLENPS